MGRSGYSNPMQEHHRKARQKELQKNKQKRMKERDEKAIQTKTVREVKEEIRKLERDMKRHHGHQQKTNAEHKLARLQKELKLLQEAAAAARAKADAQMEANRIANRYRQPQRPLTELDDPRKSVYYDAKMNPFGAPPPGKPRLYHRRFGGVTPNIHEAVIPGEEPQVPLPPPRNDRNDGRHSHPFQRHEVAEDRNDQRERQSAKMSSKPRPDRHRERASPSKRQPLEMPPTRQTLQTNMSDTDKPEKDSTIEQTKESTSPNRGQMDENEHPDLVPTHSPESETTPKKAYSVPSLPVPSRAVQRTIRVARKKNKKASVLADIWASTEEVEYERYTNRVDLEADDLGTTKVKQNKKKKKNKPPLEIFYRDNSGVVQGPFTKDQMRGWIDAGYFPPSTKARTSRMDPDGWVPIVDLPALKENPETPATDIDTNDTVQDRIAALKGESRTNSDAEDPSMQARIAALKADLLRSSEVVKQRDDSDNDSVQDRIAALREYGGGGENGNNPSVNPGGSVDNEDFDPSIQTRIAAMKADLSLSFPSTKEHPHDPNRDSTASLSLKDRIIALRNSAPQPLPSASQTENDNKGDVGPSPYPSNEDSTNGVSSYPIDNEDFHATVAYPVPGYPTGDDEVAPYPVYDEDNDAIGAYPLDDNNDYPNAEELTYPVTESYPVEEHIESHDSHPTNDTSGEIATTRKVVRVDKALVSFVPTHLRNKKRKADMKDDPIHQKKRS